MRDLRDIYDEAEAESIRNNCQSVRAIAISAMGMAIKEAREEILEQIEKLL